MSETTMSVERELANDIAKHALVVGPALIAMSTVIWGTRGASSAAYAVGIVVVNLLLAAAMLAWAAPKGATVLMGAALGGFLVRMGLVTAAVWAVEDASWIELVPLAVVVVVAHLGLLFWETRYVSASLAFPGLKPKGA